MDRTRLIAVGNVLRSDDGVAHHVLELLGPIEGVVSEWRTQLTPELAVEIAPADVVVVIDADSSAEEASLERIQAGGGRGSAFAHTLTAEELIGLAERLYAFHGTAYVCRVPARDFSTGDQLSPIARRAAVKAVELLRRMPR